MMKKTPKIMLSHSKTTLLRRDIPILGGIQGEPAPTRKESPRALTIAGSDSGGCAGIQADIKTFSALGVFGMSAIVAVTCQNTKEVAYVEPISTKSVQLQIDLVLSDIGADAVKTGMLFSNEIIEVVVDRLKYWKIDNLVVDPVRVASSGALLLQRDAVQSIQERLFPLAAVITPNIPEAELLSGVEIKNDDDMGRACRILCDKGAKTVLLKGGHGIGKASGTATDLWFDGESFHKFSTEWVDTTNLHGTGCTYSSAIASYLAKGFSLKESIAMGKEYIGNAIKYSHQLNIADSNGPVNHFYE
ncbi:MAG: bifunctional hydroxymethylpyrimidine kinase/phosphomethylpyrimidine kinase [Deferribacteraceae bacterium]|jgi:hydroxymethylpyrimidine/phosphomethylpyrimidine kinase|nr:bifunctional hydroxymethylpyrimidine kinase/phosphomethylpyrimidine kinase [Deferribacteraceae bacterium]